MKRLSLIVLVVSLLIMTNSALAATWGEWIGDPCVSGEGSWSNGPLWDPCGPPPVPGTADIKFRTDPSKCTVDSDVGNYSGSKMAISNNAVLEIVSGGSIGVKELKVGDSSAGGGDIGYLSQTGGTIYGSGQKIIVGYKPAGVGYYTISGGDLGIAGDIRLMVGAGASSAGAIGTFTVDGPDPNINIDELWVGARDFTDSGEPGTGTLEFKLGSSVSPINVDDKMHIDAGGDDSEANLIVTATVAPKHYVILVKNASGVAVSGTFDNVTLSGLGDFTHLRYDFDSGDGSANDIALVPEPATVALFGLGLIAAVRRRPRKK